MKILIVCSPRTSVMLAVEVARSMPDATFDMFVDYIQPRDLVEIRKTKNINLLRKMIEAVIHLPGYVSLITFGSSLHQSAKNCFFFAGLFKKYGIPRYEIQHGLFQQGITINLSSAVEEGAIVTDHVVSWREYGVPMKVGHNTGGCAIGVMTNLHWGAYSDLERSLFNRSIDSIARAHPDIPIKWRHHPSELVRDQVYPGIGKLGWPISNLRSMSFDESEKEIVDEFLSDVNILISTPSTVILDGQRLSKKTIVFNSKKLSPYFSDFKSISVARTPDEFKRAVSSVLAGEEGGDIDTGLSIGFDGKALSKLIDRNRQDVGSIQIEDVAIYALELAGNIGLKLV